MASLPLFSALLLFTFLCYSEANLINDICSEAMNPSLCNQVFKSDPCRSARADLRGLGQIIIEKSTAAAKEVIAVAKSFPGSATEVCMDTCGSTVDSLEKCSGLLKECSGAGCKVDVQVEGSAAHSNVGTCEDAFKEIGVEPAPLKTAAKRAEDLIDVFLVIADKL